MSTFTTWKAVEAGEISSAARGALRPDPSSPPLTEAHWLPHVVPRPAVDDHARRVWVWVRIRINVRIGAIGALVAHAAPLVEGVGRRILVAFVSRRGCRQPNLFVRLHAHYRQLAGDATLALPNGDRGGVCFRVDIKAVIARLGEGE